MNVDSVSKQIKQEGDWLTSFEELIGRSASLRQEIGNILDNFQSHLDSIETNVLPMHEANGKLQIKQQNIQKLLKTIDATVQFYGRTSELETAIRDGNPGLDLDTYIEHMECLQQAINFFQSHPSYSTQLENMKMTLENGYVLLEKEYRNVVNANSIQADPATIINCLDDQYELIAGRVKEIRTVRSVEKMAKLAKWLLERQKIPPKRFLSYFSQIRGENMNRTLEMLSKLKSGSRPSRPVQASGRRNRSEKAMGRDGEGTEIEPALLAMGSFVALVSVEESVLERAIPDVTLRAQVHRDLFSKPLQTVLKVCERVLNDGGECGLPPLLPLLRFTSTHSVQLNSIAANSLLDSMYTSFEKQLVVKCNALLSEFVDAIRNDPGKFVPADGNVHPTTASTLKLMYLLTTYRHTITQHLLVMSAAPSEPSALLMPKLFARILSALGSNLSRKRDLYDEPTLASLFLLNNYNYIAKALEDREEGGLMPVIMEQNSNILSYYQELIKQQMNAYMNSWASVMLCLSNAESISPDDRNAIKSAILTFNREFEQTVSSQRELSVADAALADEIRAKVKRTVVPAYSKLYTKANALHGEAMGKHLRYSEESLEVNIDRLFDISA